MTLPIAKAGDFTTRWIIGIYYSRQKEQNKNIQKAPVPTVVGSDAFFAIKIRVSKDLNFPDGKHLHWYLQENVLADKQQ